MTESFWAPGTEIMWRYGPPGLDFADPRRVIKDDADALVAWLPVGTPILKLVRADGRDLRAEVSDAFLVERRQVVATWERTSVLRVHQPGRRWSLWHFFDGAGGEFLGWYANIEDPHERSGLTTRSRDHVLDIWIEPDRAFARKDERELDVAVEQGRYTIREAAAITSVADEIEEAIRQWSSPFCDGWEQFVPDPAWPRPVLHEHPNSRPGSVQVRLSAAFVGE